jgi:hypothetical protein
MGLIHQDPSSYLMSIEFDTSKLTLIPFMLFHLRLDHQDPSPSSCRLRLDTSKLTLILMLFQWGLIHHDPSSVHPSEARHIQIDNKSTAHVFSSRLNPPDPSSQFMSIEVGIQIPVSSRPCYFQPGMPRSSSSFMSVSEAWHPGDNNNPRPCYFNGT